MNPILTKGQQVAVGSIFLTAGLQKAFGAEPFTAVGFLKFGTNGTPFFGAASEGVVYNPLQGFWADLAANGALMPFINWLVVFGQVAIGLALILGLATRFASVMGTVMMVFFLVAAWEFEHGIVNQHLAYALITGFIGYLGAGRYFGLDAVIEKMQYVRSHSPQLRFVLG